jgi:hypothetical protein
MKSTRHIGSSGAVTPLDVQALANGHPLLCLGNRSSVAEYLSRNPVTGLLIAKDDQILCEHYQYGRTDRDRFMSQSMAKSITAMLIGIAIGEGAIKSVDDAPAHKSPANYIPPIIS